MTRKVISLQNVLLKALDSKRSMSVIHECYPGPLYLSGCRRARCGDRVIQKGREECDTSEFNGKSCSLWRRG